MNNLPTILDEIDAIHDQMREAPTAYFRNEPLQARYRSLISQRADATEGSIVDDAGEGGPLLPIAKLPEFVAQGGNAAHYDFYLKAMRTAADWLFALPAGEQRSFIASFEALPDDVTDSAIEEMMSPAPQVPWSSDRAVDEFKKLPAGAVLSREWKHETARNLARVRERLFRVIDRMERESSVTVFLDWLDGLSTASATALYRKLAA